MGINYNLLSYALFLPFSGFITVWVGKQLHSKGRLLMEKAFLRFGFKDWVTPVNNTLLLGYYLLNLGNVLLVLTTWEKPNSIMAVFESLSIHLGFILCLLGVIHAFNMITLLVMNFIHIKSTSIN